jgi:hypothetical protein
MDWSSIKIIFPLPKKLTRHAIGGKDVFSMDTFDIEYLIGGKWCIHFFCYNINIILPLEIQKTNL